jgi:type I restriction enzyme R subunit
LPNKLESFKKSQTNHYWATMTDQSFDHLAEQLAPLMHFRDGRGWSAAVRPSFNFADVLAAKEFVEFGPEHESLSIAQYRQVGGAESEGAYREQSHSPEDS